MITKFVESREKNEKGKYLTSDSESNLFLCHTFIMVMMSGNEDAPAKT